MTAHRDGAPEPTGCLETSASVSPKTWSGQLVEAALSAGLVGVVGDDVKLTSSGAAYLRRAMIAHEASGAREINADPVNAYRAQHQVQVQRTLDPGQVVTINECESPLGWLRNRKDRRTGKALISKSQFDAGERLREDFLRGQLSARVTASWSDVAPPRRNRRSGASSRNEICDSALSARDRFYGALEAVGEELCDVLVWVCCDGRGLRDIEQAAGWPQRSGKLLLQTALKALARHYGLEPSRNLRGSHGRGKVVQWGEPGYRPEISEEP